MQVKIRMRLFISFTLTFLCTGCSVAAWNTEYTIHNSAQKSHYNFREEDIVTLAHDRVRRQAPAAVPPALAATAPATLAGPPSTLASSRPASAAVPSPAEAATDAPATDIDKNKTTNQTDATSQPPATVTRIPLLGVNGSGILKVNLTDNMPRVSDPILPDDNITDIVKDMPETIKAEHNLTKAEYDNHNFYNSTFIGNKTYFDEHWTTITKPPAVTHGVLSNSHRRATTIKLSFDFPFYGHPIRNITVASGGFIYTGDHVHYWLAATQYIAPLMANFDNRLTNESAVKLIDDGEKFTALWENVTLKEDSTKNFTFAATLYKNGDITFAYKHIPIPVQDIDEDSHPVKVGISDAYQTERIMFFVRRKTIYEYHRVSFKDHEITSGTMLKLVALPTCVQYTNCASCVNHDTGFNCSWCDQIQKCSSGTDRNKQDWMLRHCDVTMITDDKSCPAPAHNGSATNESDSTAYFTDNNGPYYDPVIRTGPGVPGSFAPRPPPAAAAPAAPASPVSAAAPTQAHSPVGGVVTAFVVIALVASLAGWLLYAFKNPHTKSGQMLIKYRPTQWSWKRGEARYTAATIHM